MRTYLLSGSRVPNKDVAGPAYSSTQLPSTVLWSATLVAAWPENLIKVACWKRQCVSWQRSCYLWHTDTEDPKSKGAQDGTKDLAHLRYLLVGALHRQ